MELLQMVMYGGALAVCLLVGQALLRGQLWIGRTVDVLVAALVERIKRAEEQTDTLIPTMERLTDAVNALREELRREDVRRKKAGPES